MKVTIDLLLPIFCDGQSLKSVVSFRAISNMTFMPFSVCAYDRYGEKISESIEILCIHTYMYIASSLSSLKTNIRS